MTILQYCYPRTSRFCSSLCRPSPVASPAIPSSLSVLSITRRYPRAPPFPLLSPSLPSITRCYPRTSRFSLPFRRPLPVATLPSSLAVPSITRCYPRPFLFSLSLSTHSKGALNSQIRSRESDGAVQSIVELQVARRSYDLLNRRPNPEFRSDCCLEHVSAAWMTIRPYQGAECHQEQIHAAPKQSQLNHAKVDDAQSESLITESKKAIFTSLNTRFWLKARTCLQGLMRKHLCAAQVHEFRESLGLR